MLIIAHSRAGENVFFNSTWENLIFTKLKIQLAQSPKSDTDLTLFTVRDTNVNITETMFV